MARFDLPIVTGKSLDLFGTASALNDVLLYVDTTEYSWVSFQLTGVWTANLIVQVSNDNLNWQQIFYYNISSNTIGNAIASNGIYNVPKLAEYMRVIVNSYTSGTISAIGQATNNISPSLPVQSITFNGSQSVDTELPPAIAVNDNLGTPSSPLVGSANILYNGATWDRQRSGASTGTGLGRALSATGTSAIALMTNVSTTGAGSVANLSTAYLNLTAQLVITSGSLTVISCDIEGSLNGSNWYNIINLASIINGSAVKSNLIPFIYLRANLVTLTGTSPVISILAGAV
jgi:hypothetical protein